MASGPYNLTDLTALDLGPRTPVLTPQQIQAQRNSLAQAAGQLQIQKQVQAENQLKIQAQARAQQDDEMLSNAIKSDMLQGPAPTTPIPTTPDSTGGMPSEEGAEPDAAALAPPPVATGPAPSAPQGPNLSPLGRAAEKLFSQGKISSTSYLRYQQEDLAHQQAVLALTKDKREEAEQSNALVGAPLSAAYEIGASDPEAAGAQYDTARRIAVAKGLDVTGWPQHMPDMNTEAGKKAMEGLVFGVNYENHLIAWGKAKAEENQRQETADAKKAADARAQLLSDRSEGAQGLVQAPDADTYASIRGALRPEIAAAFPSALPPDGMTDAAKRGLLRAAMKPEDAAKDMAAEIKERAEAKKEADKQAEDANKPSQEKWIADLAAANQADATPAQKKAGLVAKFALDRLSKLKQDERPVTNNQFTPPATTGSAPPDISQAPEAVRGTVQAIIRGDAQLPAQTRNNPTADAERYWVNKIDPAYSQERYDVKKSFTAGKDSDNVKSLNTVIAHLGALSDNAAKLDNSEFKKYNNFGNWLQAQAGTDKTAPFTVDRLGVSSELATALKGGVASEAEANNWQKEIDSSDTPQTLKNKVSEIAHVVAGRFDALENKRSILPEDSRSKPLLSPSAQSVVNRLSTGGTVAPIPLKDGTTLVPHDAAAAAKFRQDHADLIK